MKAKLIFLILFITISTCAIGACPAEGVLLRVDADIGAAIIRPSTPSCLNTEGADAVRSNDSGVIAHRTGIRQQVVTGVHSELSADYENNVRDLIQSRWFFRKAANYSEGLGNALLYIGSGAASVAASVKLIGSEDISNIFLFSGTACFAAHITLIGIAKCSAREEGERENQLSTLAQQVKFGIVPLNPQITDEYNGETPPKLGCGGPSVLGTAPRLCR